jgi:proteasome lid subunit RPN8/RPN11
MSAPVVLPAPVRRAILRHVRETAPRECCGLLLGAGRRIQYAVPMRNVARRPRTSYRIAPGDHLQLRRWLRQFGPTLGIVGAYHSHPGGPARPSPRDLAEAHYPDWIWLIVGANGVGVFAIKAGRATRRRVDRT